MSETMQIALLSAVINGAVTWGIISTKLAWLRRDVDALAERMTGIDRRCYAKQDRRNNEHELHQLHQLHQPPDC